MRAGFGKIDQNKPNYENFAKKGSGGNFYSGHPSPHDPAFCGGSSPLDSLERSASKFSAKKLSGSQSDNFMKVEKNMAQKWQHLGEWRNSEQSKVKKPPYHKINRGNLSTPQGAPREDQHWPDEKNNNGLAEIKEYNRPSQATSKETSTTDPPKSSVQTGFSPEGGSAHEKSPEGNKVTNQPSRGKTSSGKSGKNPPVQSGAKPKANPDFTKLFSPTDGQVSVLSPMFYIKVKIRRTEVQPLLDSGASDNFISVNTAQRLKLRLHNLHEGQSFSTADGHVIPCKYFVRVWMKVNTNKGQLNWPLLMKLAPMQPDLNSWPALPQEI